VLALAYVATIESSARFASSRTVGNYVGLAPAQYASGAKTPELRISKIGDGFLRRLLVNAAAYILGPFGEDSDLRRYGGRIAASGSQRDEARARIAVARSHPPGPGDCDSSPELQARAIDGSPDRTDPLMHPSQELDQSANRRLRVRDTF